MKKSRIISVALTLALVLTTVFAGTEGVFADTTMRMKGMPSTAVKALANSDDGSVTATDMNSTTKAPTYGVKYSQAKPFVGAVKIPKAGTFEFNVFAGADTTIALFDSLTASEPIAYKDIYRSTSNEDYDSFYVNVKKAGTYYLAFYTNSSSECSSSFNAYYAPKQVANLKLGKSYWAASTNGSYVYYKVKASSTGYITMGFSSGYDGNSAKYSVKVMNSSKKKNLLKNVEVVNSNKKLVTFAGVAKGTYYVAVKTTNPYYQINLKFKKVSENSGSSRSKAKAISKGGTKRGTILATQTSSNADWYKVKINSSQLVKLSFNTLTGGPSGGFRISVYSGSKTKSFGSADFYYGDPGDVLSLTTKINGIDTGRLQKGTYYIKVQKYGKGTGYYELKWL